MGIPAHTQLVVKRTFLEFVECSQSARPRSLTDSAISAAEVSNPQHTPLSESYPSNVKAPEASDSTVNESATVELKAFLGLGQGEEEKENSPFCSPACFPKAKAPPILPSLEEEQTDYVAQTYWAENQSMVQCGVAVWMTPTCMVSHIPIAANIQKQWEDNSWVATMQPSTPSAQTNLGNIQKQWEDNSWVATMQPSTPSTQANLGKPAKAADAFANAADMPENMRTTVIMRNIPNNYTRAMLLELLDGEGFASRYDFLYIPVDFNSQAGLGYAFVNLVTPEWAQAFWSHFEGFRNWALPSEKVCALNWSCPLQGLEAHIERYRNSPVMHHSMPDDFKPVIFIDGERFAFPPPTKAIKAPKIRSRPQESHSQY